MSEAASRVGVNVLFLNLLIFDNEEKRKFLPIQMGFDCCICEVDVFQCFAKVVDGPSNVRYCQCERGMWGTVRADDGAHVGGWRGYNNHHHSRSISRRIHQI